MPYWVLPLSVLLYVVRLIKEHIMSLKLGKKLVLYIPGYKRFSHFCSVIIEYLELGQQKSCNMSQYIAMCNISIFFIRRIVLYCSNEYCNISIYLHP